MSEGERPWSGRRLHFVGVGGAGMSAYARAARALGATVSGSDGAEQPLPASACAPTACSTAHDRPRGGERPAGDGRRGGPLLRGRRRERRAARSARAGHPRAPARELLAELSAAAADDRGRRDARQDDDLLDARPRAARRGTGPGLADRGLRRRWSAERPLDGRGVAGRRGRRVRPLAARARRRDRRADQRRARPPPTFASLAELREAFAALLAGARPRRCSGTGPSCSRSATGRRSPRRAGCDADGGRLALPLAGTRGLAAGARARTTRSTRPVRWRPPALAGADRDGRGSRARRIPGRRPALPAGWGRAAGGAASTTTTPTTRPRSPRRSRRRARSSTGAWSPYSSPTCTRARGCSPRDFGARARERGRGRGARRLPGARARRGPSRA